MFLWKRLLRKEKENLETNQRIQFLCLIEVVLNQIARIDIGIKIEILFQMKLVRFLVTYTKEENLNTSSKESGLNTLLHARSTQSIDSTCSRTTSKEKLGITVTKQVSSF